MGKPGPGNTGSSGLGRRRTRGTETSQYPEEKKSIEIPQVAASERGGAQTRAFGPGGCRVPARGRKRVAEGPGKVSRRG